MIIPQLILRNRVRPYQVLRVLLITFSLTKSLQKLGTILGWTRTVQYNVWFVFATPHLLEQQMPQIIEKTVSDWDNMDNDCHRKLLECSWTITAKDGSLTVIITCLKGTFKYDFWIRVTTHPHGDPNTSKQTNFGEQHPLLKLISKALYKYEEFPEPHLKPDHFRIPGELLDYLD